MMKSFFKKLAFVMALAMVVSLAAPAATTAAAATDMKIAYQNGKSGISELNIAEVGAKEDLKALNAPKNWKEVGMNWESSNPAVATVNNSGEVEAKAAGTAVVTVTCGDATASVTVYCVDTQTYKVTMGTSNTNLMTEATMEVGGDAIDFAFFGVKDYDQGRYHCTWASTDTSVIKVNPKNGYTEAVGEGTAKVTLIAFNKITGEVHDVAPCTVTVGAKTTPAPAQSVAVKGGFNTTEVQVALEFKGFDTEIFKDNHKEYIEIYETFEGEVSQDYIWQIKSVSIDSKDKNIVYVNGYTTHELVDGSTYVVNVVDKNGETILTTKFEASVGAVAKVAPYYGSYLNNQDEWGFPGKAYTNCGAGEDIYTYIAYDLFDENGVNVTGHYQRLYAETDLISLDVLTDDVDYYMELDDSKNNILFTDIPEVPVQIEVEYNDYNNGEPVTALLVMEVKEVIPYRVASVDKWNLTITKDALVTGKDIDRQWLALYDDYNLADGTELKNHEIVLWFTDNYGNKWVTNSAYHNEKVDGAKYKFIEGSKKFSNEGFELRYETRNPQVLVVGDDETIDGSVNSSVITTKKVGTASINVTLHDAFADELISRLDVLKVVVKDAREVRSVSANNISVLTDSKSEGVPTTGQFSTDWSGVPFVQNDANDAATTVALVDKYDRRFTEGTVDIKVKDQYGDVWGLFNNSAFASIDISATSSNEDAAVLAGSDWTWVSRKTSYEHKFDGVKLFKELDSEKTSSVSYKVTVVDKLNDYAEKTANFRVSLSYPTEDANTHKIETKSKVVLEANSTTYTTANDLSTYINVYEQSANGFNVNYADDITFIANAGQRKDVFSDGAHAGYTIAKGVKFIEVIDPKGNYVGASDGTTIGIIEHESGLYEFKIGNDYNGTQAILFTTAGSYTVRLHEVTSVKTVDGDTVIDGYKTYTQKLTVKKDFETLYVTNQDEIYLDRDYYVRNEVKDAIDALSIADQALSFNVDVNNYTWWNKGFYNRIAGVRYRKNTRDNALVIQDVFVKVMYDTNQNGYSDDDTGAYYFVEIPVDMTVTLEDIDMINNIPSVKMNLNPEGNRMQK